MQQSIDEIRTLRNEGKKKWGRDLIDFLKPYFEKKCSYAQIIKILENQYNFEIDVNALTNLKFRYYKENKALGSKLSNLKNSVISTEENRISEYNDVVQNKDNSKSELEKSFDEIFGDEDILGKQKREREALFSKNIMGGKW